MVDFSRPVPIRVKKHVLNETTLWKHLLNVVDFSRPVPIRVKKHVLNETTL